MITILSLVTSVKDYFEIVHKLIETDSSYLIKSYDELGPILTYISILLKDFFVDVISLKWLQSVWNLPIIIPEISSAMISEISVLDGYFHNAFNFLDTSLSYGNQNITIYSLEKFIIGLMNSIFLILPTGTTHLITLRRFLMQGLEAGYISGLGTIAGNVLYIGSIVLGCRFFIIPWLSLDIFRYILGFILIIKYMWDSYNERRMVLEDVSKQKIFLLNFVLALTEQTSIYPFISNISIGPESSILESFPSVNSMEFFFIHGAYLLGITIGSLSLLHFTCWFWENPAFKIYMWLISSFKVSTTLYYKIINFVFLYLTMVCAISSIPYYGLDYTLTNPLGLVHDDRIVDQKLLLETSFLNTKASDRNTRRNRGRHGRRERWKRRVRKYRTFDASLYDQGVYDLFTIEDLNYGFDRFWLRRKMRNHRVRFRFFPGPWMRSFKKQLSKPRLESYTGPRSEFFRMLYEQVYHPSFHEYSTKPIFVNEGTFFYGKDNFVKKNKNKSSEKFLDSYINTEKISTFANKYNRDVSLYSFLPKQNQLNYTLRDKSSQINQGANKNEMTNSNLSSSTLRKFVRKVNTRLKTSLITYNLNNNSGKSYDAVPDGVPEIFGNFTSINQNQPIYSKKWKQLFSKIYAEKSENYKKGALDTYIPNFNQSNYKGFLKNFYNKVLKDSNKDSIINEKKSTLQQIIPVKKKNMTEFPFLSEFSKNMSAIDRKMLRYKSFYLNQKPANIFLRDNLKNPSKKNKEQYQVPPKKDLGSLFKLCLKDYQKINSSVLFHPLQFYLKKQEAFERKLRYYTPTIFRKFSIENNAPYFRIMNKRYFYYYKPNIRWERTMKAATLRKARRKTSRIPRKLQLNDDLGFIDNSIKQSLNESIKTGQRSSAQKNKAVLHDAVPYGVGDSVPQNTNNPIMAEHLSTRIQPPTHNYTVVGKKASRYRFQIYKDVLQHWYYSPFNRLLMKFDVDSFIRRQPRTHFLTKKEEKILHLRRFLLNEHYNTLRWYTYMQHYRSMKTKIGGTKSFANRIYNQQFMGTFKKIRHLFAITPSQNEQKKFYVLKFDQPLYNEYPNNSKEPLLNNLLLHEELIEKSPLTGKTLIEIERKQNMNSEKQNLDTEGTSDKRGDPRIFIGPYKNLGAEDLLSQSTNIIRTYLLKATPMREEYIKTLLLEKNYQQLNQFFYNGLKIRGTNPITNQRLLNQQEKVYLLPEIEFSKDKAEKSELAISETKRKETENLQQELWINLLKKWKRKVNDQEFLKNYLSRRVDKRERTKKKKQKLLKNKLDKLLILVNSADFSKDYAIQTPLNNLKNEQNSLIFTKLANSGTNNKDFHRNNLEQSPPDPLLTTGLQKAIMEGIFSLNNLDLKIISNKEKSLIKIANNNIISNTDGRGRPNKNYLPLEPSVASEQRSGELRSILTPANQSNFLQSKIKQNNLMNWSKVQKQKNISNSIKSLTKILKKKNDSLANGVPEFLTSHYSPGRFNNIKNFTKVQKIKYKMRSQLKSLSRSLQTNFLNLFNNKFVVSPYNKLTDLFGFRTTPSQNFKNWEKEERKKTKQKRLRKLFFSQEALSRHRIRHTKKTINNSNNKETLGIRRTILSDKNINKKNMALENTGFESSNTNNIEYKADITTSGSLEWTPSLNPLRKKQNSLQLNKETSLGNSNKQSFNELMGDPVNSTENTKIEIPLESGLQNILDSQTSQVFSHFKKFKRKKSPQRRSRTRRGRGVIRKRTLADSLKQEFKKIIKYEKNLNKQTNLQKKTNDGQNYGVPQRAFLDFKQNSGEVQNIQLAKKRAAFYSKVNQNIYLLINNGNVREKNMFKPKGLKQRRSFLRKQRYWKEKRSKYVQKRRKYKKRQNYVVGKIRMLSKQYKRIKSKMQIKNWWWQNFIPNFKATTDSLWQIEKERQIQEKLVELSSSDILKKDNEYLYSQHFSNFDNNSKNFIYNKTLQIGDTDFKPLSIPEAIRIRHNITDHKDFINNREVPLSLYGVPEITEKNNKQSLNEQKIGELHPMLSGTSLSLYTEGTSGKEDSLASEQRSPQKNQWDTSVLNSVNSKKREFNYIDALPENLLNEKNNNSHNLKNLSANLYENIYMNINSKNANGPINILGSPTPKILEGQTVWQSASGTTSGTASSLNNTKQILLSPFYAGWDESLRKFIITNRLLSRREAGFQANLIKPDSFSKTDNRTIPNLEYLTTSLWLKESPNLFGSSNEQLNKESLNKIGFNNDKQINDIAPHGIPYLNSKTQTLEFDSAPLKGMNAATTLYWQIPFTTYDPDQFFALGMDGFSPIGWRRFQFRHSILKSWLFGISNQTVNKSKKIKNYSQFSSSKQLIYKLNQRRENKSLFSLRHNFNTINKKNSEKMNSINGNKQNSKNIYRRLKKRYKRVKKHPRSPVWFPSGPLLNQVLPVHYIYVFYKRARLPRDRYIKRRLLKNTTITNKSSTTNLSNFDFTLRKRVKTKRKYHKKRDLTKKIAILPRRLKFLKPSNYGVPHILDGVGNAVPHLEKTKSDSFNQNSSYIGRPLSLKKMTKPISELVKEQRLLKSKQRKQELRDKQSVNVLRVRQLRRRVQRQVIRSVWRYRPRAGGFIWPGDYLRLETVKAPQLHVKKTNDSNNMSERKLEEININTQQNLRKVKRKKKRNIQEWQIQPKKYLLEKHNRKVIKKKLEKAQRSNKIEERLKQLKLAMSNNF
nr:hypothetical chloroplast RF1 [Borodinellopsis texensis]